VAVAGACSAPASPVVAPVVAPVVGPVAAVVGPVVPQVVPTAPIPALPAVAASALRPVTAFAAIADPATRSQALVLEMHRVLGHPRCVNCHPADDSPRQRDGHELHDPPVLRGDEDRGVAGMRCATCHQDRNAVLARVPGAPDWHLAPRAMAWLGKDAAALCAQLKDPTRNGHRPLARIAQHLAQDALVGWGWAPGADRAPAPGSQAELGALAEAWIATGAVCPTAEQSKEASR
jgi:hypothetical protein